MLILTQNAQGFCFRTSQYIERRGGFDVPNANQEEAEEEAEEDEARGNEHEMLLIPTRSAQGAMGFVRRSSEMLKTVPPNL